MIEPETAPETPPSEPEPAPEPEPQPEPSPEPPSQPEPAEGEPAPVELEETTLDEAEAEANLLEGEIEATQRHLASLLGIPLDDETVTCPTCRLGWLPHQVLESRSHERCPDCDGWGVVVTGSRVLDNETASCGRCQGKGWDSKFELPPLQPAQTPSESPTSAPTFDYTQVQVPQVPPLAVGN